MFVGVGEEPGATLQPGAARGGMFPAGQGGGIAEAEDDLLLVIARRSGQHARAEVAGEVGGQLLAFVQPGAELWQALAGHAASHQHGDGGHRVSPGGWPRPGRVRLVMRRRGGGGHEESGKDYSHFVEISQSRDKTLAMAPTCTGTMHRAAGAIPERGMYTWSHLHSTNLWP